MRLALNLVELITTFDECVQEVMQLDEQVGLIALGRFKSCVRTTLLLCKGYECKEQQGSISAAFVSPSDALDWAVMLQLALLRSVVMFACTTCCYCHIQSIIQFHVLGPRKGHQAIKAYSEISMLASNGSGVCNEAPL